MKRKLAFTLAEVLITLGIIGVVASLTLPPMKKSLDERAAMSSLKKFYSEFSNATRLIMVDNDLPIYWGLYDNNDDSSEMVMKLYKKHMVMIKECSKTDSSCFPFPIRGSNGNEKITATNYRNWSMRGFILKNGTTVCFDVNNNWFSVFFDINGFKKPNKLGEDVFAWAVNGRGQIVSIYDSSITDGSGQDHDYDYAFVYMKNGWRKPK